jgi:hypothetical protein
MADMIRCPHCRSEFEMTSAVADQLRDGIRRELETHARAREAEIAERELAIQGRERAVDAAVQVQLDAARTQLLQEAAEKARDGFAMQIKTLDDQLGETRARLQEAQATELQLRKERVGLDDERRTLQLTIQRTLDDERSKIQERVRREADEEHRLKIAEKDKQMGDMLVQIDELKRKAAPAPAHAIGEVLEQDIEQLLRAQFPQDRFEPVPDAHRGGDILQHVRDEAGRECGSILWEVKRTKNWQSTWLGKLREDQRLAKARLAVLVTQELPRDVADFACIDGIHVTRRLCALPLVAVLRLALAEVARAERNQQNRHGKAGQLLAYITGNDFTLRFRALIDSLLAMQTDLESEKRSVEKLWAKRFKQLAIAMANATGFHGELAGILGGSLPGDDRLELTAIDPDAA